MLPRLSINPSRINSPNSLQLQILSLVMPSWMRLVFYVSVLLNFLSNIDELCLTSMLSFSDHKALE